MYICAMIDKINENIQVIKDSYNDYISIDNEKEREAMARQIFLTAKGYIKNRGGELQDWIDIFRDQNLVVSKLEQLNFI